jgi:hypothetical protein
MFDIDDKEDRKTLPITAKQLAFAQKLAIRMRRLRPIEFPLARGGDGLKRRALGSSSGTTRRGPYAPLTCWV